jgi:hypothetical protein
MKSFNNNTLNRSKGTNRVYREYHDVMLQSRIIISLLLCTLQVPYNKIQLKLFAQADDISTSEGPEYPSRQFVLVWDAEEPIAWGEWVNEWVSVLHLHHQQDVFIFYIKKPWKVVHPSSESTKRRVAYKNIFHPSFHPSLFYFVF